MKVNRYILILSLALFAIACESEVKVEKTETTSEEKTDPDSIVVALYSPVSSEGEVNYENQRLKATGETWSEYEIEVPFDGRYRVEIAGKSFSDTSVVWIEDHVHNKDDRTYNITSSIHFIKASESSTVGKDGSPMRAGMHSIRLHTKGNLELTGLRFDLLRKHEITPVVMTQNMEGDDWELVWSDEFEGTGLPDTTKWTFDVGNWGWGNGELQYYTVKRAENARLEDGNLIIEAHKNDMDNPWTSARLTTRGKTSFVYGKIEFRAKVPAEKGNWAAGWTLGDEYVDEFSWPYCGEIDILESVGYEMDNATGNGIAHASAHCGAYYFKLGNQPTGTIEVENMEEAFHTYSVVWTSDYIEAFVDDQSYFKYDDNSSELSWPFSKPQNLILNLAMGGGWGGLMGMDESVSKQRMVIDYVRVYQKK